MMASAAAEGARLCRVSAVRTDPMMAQTQEIVERLVLVRRQ